MSQTNYFAHSLLRAHDWQHRPQLDQVCDWWRSGGTGVCALVGIGGAGKTAIAERFLQVLPDVMPQDAKIAKDRSLHTPRSTFVFSFYDAPNPEAFFEALQMWIEQTPRDVSVVSFLQLLFMVQQAPGLLILDGLEKVQEDGARGVLGKLSSPKLREFLNLIAAGLAPLLSVLITTRFPLADLRDRKPQFFHSIAVEEIGMAAGVRLLRARGVRGTDAQLEPIVRECGRHALTVDFAGGYIREYGQGDSATRLNLGTAEELAAAAEQEPHDDRREVLKQGFRFARVAQRYRDAMLNNDEAALALLERICLFRLGVDCQTLANIFTGKAAKKVSGPALARLNSQQLQQKLDWLVRMRIVEQSEPASSLKTEHSKLKISYTIHPAVRDGFLSGIGRDEKTASHDAVRKGLEVSLGDSPRENPSDPVTLDLLEEIVHHTLQSGHAPAAWDIYWNRIGGYRNLGWRLGAYERGERICRAFAGGEPPESVGGYRRDAYPLVLVKPAYMALRLEQQAFLINEWALYLSKLGRLSAAIHCYEIQNKMQIQLTKWDNASKGKQNLCDVWLFSGRLPSGLSTATEALQLAKRANDAGERYSSHAYLAHACALRGEVSAALAAFGAALRWQHKVEGNDNIPLWSNRGILHSLLLTRLGRSEISMRLTEANLDVLAPWGVDDPDKVNCNLVLSDLHRESGDLPRAESLCAMARDWAMARDAKETLCWSARVQACIELAKAKQIRTEANEGNSNFVSFVIFCSNSLEAGLKVARDCGFGIFHIDLLLERVRLNLLRGNPQAALDDLRVALDTGIRADEATGQPELLAAAHPECGYAWAIPAGLHLRAEALLLQAAQSLGGDSFVIAKNPQLPANVQVLIQEAETCLTEALARWQPLRDPAKTNANFRHPETRKQYNYRAADTYRVLVDLAGGILTRYPIQKLNVSPEIPLAPRSDDEVTMAFDVFLSHNSHDKPAVREMKQRLVGYQLFVWFDEDELQPGIPWQQLLEAGIKNSSAVAVLIGKDGLGPWEDEEMQGALRLAVKDKRPVIPVLMPGATSQPNLPMFLGNRTWVDLRGGITKDGLDKLVWGITGKKPNP